MPPYLPNITWSWSIVTMSIYIQGLLWTTKVFPLEYTNMWHSSPPWDLAMRNILMLSSLLYFSQPELDTIEQLIKLPPNSNNFFLLWKWRYLFPISPLMHPPKPIYFSMVCGHVNVISVYLMYKNIKMAANPIHIHQMFIILQDS